MQKMVKLDLYCRLYIGDKCCNVMYLKDVDGNHVVDLLDAYGYNEIKFSSIRYEIEAHIVPEEKQRNNLRALEWINKLNESTKCKKKKKPKLFSKLLMKFWCIQNVND